MTAGAESDRSPARPTTDGPPTEAGPRWGRPVLGTGALVLLVGCLVPPLATLARRYEFVEAIQFCLLALVVPVLAVCGAPWRSVGLASRQPPGDEEQMVGPAHSLLPLDRLALGRRRHPEPSRAVGFAVAYFAAVVLWRIPATVDALARHWWLVLVEALVLSLAGIGLWLELVESPPLSPRLSRPHRVAMAAVVMWAIWVLAYLVGLSLGSWYPAYSHGPGSAISLLADQQLTTGMIWLISGCAFIPVVFWNLIRWLQAEEDPDAEMPQLLRIERNRSGPLDRQQIAP